MNKRQKICWLLFLLSLICLSAGCTPTGWIPEATGIIQTLIPAVTGVLALLGALGIKVPTDAQNIIQNGGNEVIKDLNTVVLPLINAYEATKDPNEQQTILQQIKNAIQVVLNNWSSVLNAVHIQDQTLQDRIVAAMELVESELTALMNFIPVLQGTVSLSQVTPPLVASQLRDQYNKAIQKAASAADLPANQFTVKAAA